MLISEIFYSVQGEGELTGVPTVFVRTAGCNLRCAWCDTPYASWNPEGAEMTIEQILEKVLCHPARHCVLTGGEPMIARGIHELAASLHQADWHITIETAGTVAPDSIACDLASISPKLKNSTPLPGTIEAAWIERHERNRSRPDVLRTWVDRYPYQFKFVLAAAEDLHEIQTLMTALERDIPPWKILLMPEGIEIETLAGRQEMLVELCKATGHRYCDRLHIRLFGNTKGT